MIYCEKCGQEAVPGVCLTRTNPKGEVGRWRCDPYCGVPFDSQESALLYALGEQEPEQTDD